jgi:hypothetical protein
MGAGGQAPGPPRRGQCRARFRVGKDTAGGRVAVPQLGCDLGAVLGDDQLDQRRGVEVQPQRRCSATSSDTEPRAATLARRDERGRSGKRTSPRRTSSANASSRPIADSRATRLPRRVTTISTPRSTRSRCSLKRSCRARTPTSSSPPRCSVIHRSLAATSQAELEAGAHRSRRGVRRHVGRDVHLADRRRIGGARVEEGLQVGPLAPGDQHLRNVARAVESEVPDARIGAQATTRPATPVSS